MLRLAQAGNRKAGIVNRLLAARERLIGALLLGNNAVNILASSLATSMFLAWFGDVGVLYATAVMTVLVVVFAEVLPKTVAFNAPDRIALLVARPMDLVVRVLGPILGRSNGSCRRFCVWSASPPMRKRRFLPAHEELRGAVDLMHREGGVEKLDRDMIGGLLDLRDLTVSSVMVHRTEMVTVNADDPPEDIVNAVLRAGFTRIPLWRGTPENIVGILHAKDLLRAFENGGRRPRQDRCQVDRATALVRAGYPAAVRAAQGVPPPQNALRAGGRRIRRGRRTRHARGHLGGDRRRHLR